MPCWSGDMHTLRGDSFGAKTSRVENAIFQKSSDSDKNLCIGVIWGQESESGVGFLKFLPEIWEIRENPGKLPFFKNGLMALI